MKRLHWKSLAGSELKALEAAGYEVWVEYPWHWVVTKYHSKVKVHVWPTSGKVMAYFDSGSSLYGNQKNLIAFIDRAFNPELRVGMATEDQIEADKEVQKLKKNFLDDWGQDDRPYIQDIDQI